MRVQAPLAVKSFRTLCDTTLGTELKHPASLASSASTCCYDGQDLTYSPLVARER